MKPTPTLRKAAILISSLDARSADALLEQMGEVQAQRVRDAIMALDDIDPLEQEQIINEFLSGSTPHSTVGDGIELAGSLAGTVGPSIRRPEQVEPAADNSSAAPFAFLHDIASETVARYLLREHPQTIAVVLAHLPPPRAAAVVRSFPPKIQAEVLSRVGEIDEMHFDVVREVARGLEVVLAPELTAARKRSHGAAALQAILTAAHADGTPLAGSTVATAGRRSAKPLSPARESLPREESQRLPPIEFAQLAKLDDTAWGKILRAADQQVALLALAGASPELVSRLLSKLAPRDAGMLQRKMENLGPLRLRDIDQAQQQLARIAAQLAARGEFRLPQTRPFATAA